jgi:hypothetical protein
MRSLALLRVIPVESGVQAAETAARFEYTAGPDELVLGIVASPGSDSPRSSYRTKSVVDARDQPNGSPERGMGLRVSRW